MVGLHEALQDTPKPEIVYEIDNSGDPEEPEALEVTLDPDRPELSRANVRPWLLGR